MVRPMPSNRAGMLSMMISRFITSGLLHAAIRPGFQTVLGEHGNNGDGQID